jgi:hypothetical protein
MVETKLFLDDVRPVPSGYFLVTNYDEFVSFLEQQGVPIFISFDHDLGDVKTGYDCAKYLVEFCLDNFLTLPDYKVHSQNPVGKENIEKLLENFKNRKV